MIAHNPLHGSGQAAFPHPALTLGDNAHAAERIRMVDANGRQPADDESSGGADIVMESIAQVAPSVQLAIGVLSVIAIYRQLAAIAL